MKKVYEYSEEEFREMAEDMTGICIECGETQDGCEPDARQYECEVCGKKAVMGMEQALLEGYVTFEE